MHMHMHTHMHTHIHTHMHTCTCTHAHAHVRVQMLSRDAVQAGALTLTADHVLLIDGAFAPARSAEVGSRVVKLSRQIHNDDLRLAGEASRPRSGCV